MVPTENSYYQSTLQIEEDIIHINAAKQDLSKFSALYDKYYISVFRFVYQRMETMEIASDVSSQTFLKAMSCLSKYSNKGLPFASWLFAIARNEINLYYRKQKTERSFCLNLKDEHQLVSEFLEEDPLNPEEVLKPLLEGLNADDLELIEMRYFEKRSFNEIGVILNLTENNAKVKVHRILKKLRKKAIKTRQFEVGALFLMINSLIFAL